MATETTTVEVQHDTWRSLNRRREPGETFDDVVSDLLDTETDD